MALLREIFCECCKVMFKRPRRLIQSESDKHYMEWCGMCEVCYHEADPGQLQMSELSDFGATFEQQPKIDSLSE